MRTRLSVPEGNKTYGGRLAHRVDGDRCRLECQVGLGGLGVNAELPLEVDEHRDGVHHEVFEEVEEGIRLLPTGEVGAEALAETGVPLGVGGVVVSAADDLGLANKLPVHRRRRTVVGAADPLEAHEHLVEVRHALWRLVVRDGVPLVGQRGAQRRAPHEGDVVGVADEAWQLRIVLLAAEPDAQRPCLVADLGVADLSRVDDHRAVERVAQVAHHVESRQRPVAEGEVQDEDCEALVEREQSTDLHGGLFDDRPGGQFERHQVVSLSQSGHRRQHLHRCVTNLLVILDQDDLHFGPLVG